MSPSLFKSVTQVDFWTQAMDSVHVAHSRLNVKGTTCKLTK